MLPKDIENIIHKFKTSMIVSEVNDKIKNLQRKCYKAEDIYIYHINEEPYWNNNHNVYSITTNKDYKIKSIYLDYCNKRYIGFQWTYICKKCGEYLKLYKNEDIYYCNCHDYLFTIL